MGADIFNGLPKIFTNLRCRLIITSLILSVVIFSKMESMADLLTALLFLAPSLLIYINIPYLSYISKSIVFIGLLSIFFLILYIVTYIVNRGIFILSGYLLILVIHLILTIIPVFLFFLFLRYTYRNLVEKH